MSLCGSKRVLIIRKTTYAHNKHFCQIYHHMLLLFFPCCQGQKYHSKFFIQVFIVRFNIETRLAFCAISY